MDKNIFLVDIFIIIMPIKKCFQNGKMFLNSEILIQMKKCFQNIKNTCSQLNEKMFAKPQNNIKKLPK